MHLLQRRKLVAVEIELGADACEQLLAGGGSIDDRAVRVHALEEVGDAFIVTQHPDPVVVAKSDALSGRKIARRA